MRNKSISKILEEKKNVIFILFSYILLHIMGLNIRKNQWVLVKSLKHGVSDVEFLCITVVVEGRRAVEYPRRRLHIAD